MPDEPMSRTVNKILASDPLRQQAEREWGEAGRETTKQKLRRQKRVSARTKRRQRSKEQKDEILRLKVKLRAAKKELTQHRKVKKTK